MFIDASAIVALLTREVEADDLLKRLEAALNPITSPIAIFEAVLALCRKRRATVDEARRDVSDFLNLVGIAIVPITEGDAVTALSAFARYGKGKGHPAQLNLGDCFAYAVAKNHHVSLLFKGGDFSETDIV
jgi:ribonuclease VapC